MAEPKSDKKNDKKEDKNFWEKFKNNKKAQIIAIVIIAVLLVCLSAAGYLLTKKFKQKTIQNINETVIEPTGDAYRKIDGVLTTLETANLMPVSIIVENYKDIRPQSGLSQANIVYEALAEGGITRFLAIYADGTDIKTIGPVRSARTYFVDIAEEYGGIFAHIGGSPQALGMLSYEQYITDLNQFTYSQYYWRDEALPAPHNLFTSTEMMSYARRDLISEKAEGDYEGWQFKDQAGIADRSDKDIYIKINFSLADYLVEWKYNRENNNYLRWNGGVEHKDKNTDQQITAKNIIVQFAETSLVDPERLDIKTIGEGEALIFRDGNYILGKWRKEKSGERTKYFNDQGKEVDFDRGNTWIELVKTDTPVEWINSEGNTQKKN